MLTAILQGFVNQFTAAKENVLTHPITTMGGVFTALGQYLAVQGAVPPHDSIGWAQVILGALDVVFGAAARDPGTTAATPSM